MPNVTIVRALAFLAPLLLTQACLTESSGGGGGGGGGGSEGEGGTPQPVDHTVATGSATSNLRANVEDFEAAFDFVEASKLIEELLALFPEGDDEEMREPPPGEGPMPAGDGGGDAPPPDGGPDGNGEVEEEELDIDFGEALDEALEAIEERLLIEEQVEGEDELSVTYLLDPERVCAEEEGEAPRPADEGEGEPDGDNHEEEEGDDECRRVLGEVQLRIRVTSFAEGDIDLTLLVGEDRHEPVRVELHADRLAVQVDLAAGKAALELLLDAAAEEDDERPELPDSMAGVVRAELLKNAERDYTGSLSILQEIVVEDGGEEPITVRLGVAKPLASFRLDGNAKTATAALNVGTVDVSFPYQWFIDEFYGASDDCISGGGEGGHDAPMPPDDGEPMDPPDGEEWDCEGEGEGEEPPEVDGSLSLSLAGLSGTSTFSGEQDRLEVTGVGLGQGASTLSLGAKTLLSVDVNADHGRTLDWAVALGDDDNVRLEVTPAFDLSLLLALHHIAGDLPEDDLPSFTLDETLSVTLDGAATPALQSIGDEDERQLQVAEGTLTLASTAVGEPVVFAAGQCIAEVDEEEVAEGAHELLGNLEAVACGQ